MDFFDKLREKYTVTDFTGHIGALLDEDKGFYDEEIENADKFLAEIYELAVKNL